MLIACVQSDVSFAQPEANLARVLAWMQKAAHGPSDSAPHAAGPAAAELVVFPECMLTGYTFDSREQAREAALETESPIFTSLVEAATDWNQLVTIGFLERSGERLYNSAALLGPDGMIGCYRKIHLPGLGVDRFVDRGEQAYQSYPVETARSGEASIGLAICYDASFPEPMRVLGLSGADVIALGTNWPKEGLHTSMIVPPARSMENHLYFVAANRVGNENGFAFCGRSSICGPDGVVLARSDDDQETILFAEADLAIARNKSIERTPGAHVIDRFADRRPEFYGRIVETPDK
ncbi:carbon-nitrogen hydrolase family protein [Stieleria sp. ICT_E10.1]|uniref:carbon-nitrogen hydrolase family protein n=1 Tax=Stieleria sedimenti TaxID=2976331 RepID=UPI00217FEC60|nr:carbon-nitrogen hydrolase family protein [Stieleria sedimenti]MCS7470437.1 carbon-nitrogen hydrolase family protein [Stieleria sedimenti]